ncbi:MAG: DUF1858 domain-containing protein [Dehalococcoidales bacterium]
MKEIDLTKSVYDLTEAYPELIEILKEMGFLGVANTVARNTMGRVTTIPQGCQKMGLDMDEVVEKLTEAGFEIKPGSLS